MKKTNDILENTELKKMPFQVPEGYFENFSVEVAPRPTIVRRLTPYLAVAAALAIMVTAGTFFLGRGGAKNEIACAEEISNEDIVEYLIWSGTSVYDLIEETDENR